MKTLLSAGTLIATVFALSTVANAASVTIIEDVQNAGATTNTDIVPPTPTSSSPIVQFVSGSVAGVYRSPFEGNANPTIANGTYLAIEGAPTIGVANYILPSAANTLELLWGSVDSYNEVIFTDAGGDTLTFFGSSLNPASPGLGADFVELTTGSFDFTEVSFLNNPGQNAFEIANVSACLSAASPGEPAICAGFDTQPSPLPATLPLFVSGIAGLGGLLGWRRKKKQALLNAVPA